MKILAIETSCDETAISIVDGVIDQARPRGKILSNVVLSQIDIHKQYGGVFPALAKREHQKTLVPVLEEALRKTGLFISMSGETNTIPQEKIAEILERERDLYPATVSFLEKTKRPTIDAIAVTHGPGLEPALWVGVNFARALAFAWELPLVPVNHMEGHLFSALFAGQDFDTAALTFPALGLLVSGGHTELILVKNYLEYEVLGKTRDDAAGEAFDKVARLMGLPYPGGPEIARLAASSTPLGATPFKFPRPMIDSADYSFSFSGLKTAVLYALREIPDAGMHEKIMAAKEFQQAVIDVLIKKTVRATKEYGIKTVLLGGGVAANAALRIQLGTALAGVKTKLLLPDMSATTDNAAMIALAAYLHLLFAPNTLPVPESIVAQGNLVL